MSEQVEFSISPEGEVIMKVHGVKGPECEAITRDLRENLGVVKQHTRTREFREQPARQGVRQGR